MEMQSDSLAVKKKNGPAQCAGNRGWAEDGEKRPEAHGAKARPPRAITASRAIVGTPPRWRVTNAGPSSGRSTGKHRGELPYGNDKLSSVWELRQGRAEQGRAGATPLTLGEMEMDGARDPSSPFQSWRRLTLAHLTRVTCAAISPSYDHQVTADSSRNHSLPTIEITER
ncbi:hypothetical protein CPLU01_02295 [Colletotrichum plurivorum]|uniref:Uncharacterized protein n=1 Tax=Colletotrichum plurivorum TaxID=2175906 RepID=A0A8H6KW51_9PEZI|nr:hypothetical protein CPLU01_02295 [Colletotrichum plurivorum]